MKDLATKQNVLQEIMDLMDGKDKERLKSHPKFAAKKVEMPAEEMPEVAEESEPAIEGVDSELAEGELSQDDIRMLLEKLKDLE